MAMESTAYEKGQLGNCRRFQESQYLPTVADLDHPPHNERPPASCATRIIIDGQSDHIHG